MSRSNAEDIMKESPINHWLLNITTPLIHLLQRDAQEEVMALKEACWSVLLERSLAASFVEHQLLEIIEEHYNSLNCLDCEQCIAQGDIHSRQVAHDLARDLLSIVKEMSVQNNVSNESSVFIADVQEIQNKLLAGAINFDTADAQIMYWHGAVSEEAFKNVLLCFRLHYIASLMR